MDPNLCRRLNHLSLEQLSKYLDIDLKIICEYYNELLADAKFLDEINEQIKFSRKSYQKAIFEHEELDSIDWMAIQRIILYILVRLHKPAICLETGVFYGGNSCFILNALRRNNFGKLISIDLPSNQIKSNDRHFLVGDKEEIPRSLDVGFLIHQSLKERWDLIRGDSLQEIPKIEKKLIYTYMIVNIHLILFEKKCH